MLILTISNRFVEKHLQINGNIPTKKVALWPSSWSNNPVYTKFKNQLSLIKMNTQGILKRIAGLQHRLHNLELQTDLEFRRALRRDIKELRTYLNHIPQSNVTKIHRHIICESIERNSNLLAKMNNVVSFSKKLTTTSCA